MATKGNAAPSGVSEGLNGIVQAISATLTAPDAGPHIPFLTDMLKAVVGQIQKGNQPPPKPGGPGGAPGAPGAGGPPGGGASLGQLQGQPPQPTGPGGAGGPSPSGVSQEDLRRMVGAQAGTAA